MVMQPVLLLRLIAFLNEEPELPNDGYGLLGAYALVFFGLAIANAWYFHQTFKFITAVRAGLVAIVYDKTMQLSTSSIDKSSAVTVMSADIERIVLGLKNVHDLWANVIQVALAAWLLEKQTGVAIVLPLVVAAACGYGTLKISSAAGDQQVSWLKRIEKRIDVTTRTLSSMRGVKVSGLTGKLADSIQDLRDVELQAAAKFRWWDVGATAMGFVPVMINPVLTFAIFIAVANASSQPLDASRMFVSLSFLTIMSHPLSRLFQSGPMISSMIACFNRIGEFTETKEWSDPRVDAEEDGEKEWEVKINGGQFSWAQDSKPVLQDVNASFPRGKLTMASLPFRAFRSLSYGTFC
jgi:ABC-type multidrug transport system fused ATPase/permease subunit